MPALRTEEFVVNMGPHHPSTHGVCRLMLTMDGEKVVNCQARVAWINDAAHPTKKDLPVGMGLQFVDISTDQVAIIEQYIRQNALSAEW